LLGFLGMYTLLSLLWIILVYNHIQHGPNAPDHAPHPQSLTA
jgi:cytochrome d ubiquinol oxidase subunit I